MICGSCKTESVTVAHVKSCYVAKYGTLGTPAPPLAVVAVATEDAPVAIAYRTEPLAAAVLIPASKYAIGIADELRFYKVTAGTKNPNVRFLDQLIGAPGDWRKISVKSREVREAIFDLIRADSYFDTVTEADGTVVTTALSGAQAAAVRYSREFTRCACCDAPLSDPVSRAQGLGPVCITRFAA